MPQNLEQHRAAAALKAANAGGFKRADIAGFPGLILQNGLLAAFAYATEPNRPSREPLLAACDSTAEFLSRPLHGIAPLHDVRDARQLVDKLTGPGASNLDLQRATSEALAFFAYLKRFAPPENP